MTRWEEWKESIEYLLSEQQMPPYPGSVTAEWWLVRFGCNYTPEEAMSKYMGEGRPMAMVDVEAQRELLEACETVAAWLVAPDLTQETLDAMRSLVDAAIARVRGKV